MKEIYIYIVLYTGTIIQESYSPCTLTLSRSVHLPSLPLKSPIPAAVEIPAPVANTVHVN